MDVPHKGLPVDAAPYPDRWVDGGQNKHAGRNISNIGVSALYEGGVT